MDDDSEGEAFCLKPKRLGCCNGPAIALSELNYEYHQAFGLCAFDGMNMDIERLSREDIGAVERLVGTKLSAVYLHL